MKSLRETVLSIRFKAGAYLIRMFTGCQIVCC